MKQWSVTCCRLVYQVVTVYVEAEDDETAVAAGEDAAAAVSDDTWEIEDHVQPVTALSAEEIE